MGGSSSTETESPGATQTEFPLTTLATVMNREAMVATVRASTATTAASTSMIVPETTEQERMLFPDEIIEKLRINEKTLLKANEEEQILYKLDKFQNNTDAFPLTLLRQYGYINSDPYWKVAKSEKAADVQDICCHLPNLGGYPAFAGLLGFYKVPILSSTLNQMGNKEKRADQHDSAFTRLSLLELSNIRWIPQGSYYYVRCMRWFDVINHPKVLTDERTGDLKIIPCPLPSGRWRDRFTCWENGRCFPKSYTPTKTVEAVSPESFKEAYDSWDGVIFEGDDFVNRRADIDEYEFYVMMKEAAEKANQTRWRK